MKKIFLSLLTAALTFGLAAAQDLETATNIYNSGAEALQLGNKESALQKFQEALKVAQALGEEGQDIVTNSKNAIPGIILSIGKDLYNNKDFAGASAKFAEAEKLAAEYGVAEIAEEAKGLKTQAATMEDFEAGEAAREAKNYAAAAQAYKKVLAVDSTNAVAALYLGQSLGSTGDVKGAVEAYELAGRHGQESVAQQQISTLYLKQAAAKLKAQKYQDAIEYAEKANSVKEDDQTYLVAGQAASKLGKNNDAIKYYERFLELAPKSKNAPAIAFTVGALYHQAGNKAKAVEFYKKVLNDPKFGANAKKMIDALN